MSPSIDVLLAERHDRRENNCLHFASRAWLLLAGDGRLMSVSECDIRRLTSLMREFRRLPGPTRQPSIALMENPHGEEHIGICYQRRLLHLTSAGAEFFPIEVAQATYRNVRFYGSGADPDVRARLGR